MKGKKIIIISIIINIITIGSIYNLIKKDYLNNEKIIVKAMTEGEYETNITSLNTEHEEYANYIEKNKKKIASAITYKGVPTSEKETLESMANKIKNISGDNDLSGLSMCVYAPISYSGGEGKPVTIPVNGVKKVYIEYSTGQSNYYKLGYKINGASSYTYTSILTEGVKYNLELEIINDTQPLVLMGYANVTTSIQDIDINLTFE